MPVWHRATQALRKAGKLAVVGIVQEQHPDRAQLYKQWQGLDWPILWDPFNTTGSRAVPNVTLVDEHGIVRSTRPQLDTFVREFIEVNFAAPTTPLPNAANSDKTLITPEEPAALSDKTTSYRLALSSLMWGGPTPKAIDLSAVLAFARTRPTDAAAQFRAGVALRMRHDAPGGESNDFQRAVDAWGAALKLNPGQYIWRRRIQQYGPWLDKPYPFYDWVNQARVDLLARGATPVSLRATLSTAEQAKRDAPSSATEPDPEGRVPRAAPTWLNVSTAVATDTSDKRTTHAARVHITLQPIVASGIKWNNEAQPLRVWLDRGSLPKGASMDAWDLRVNNAGTAESTERRTVDFEVRLPAGVDRADIRGYVLFNACSSDDGRCVYVRHDLRIAIQR